MTIKSKLLIGAAFLILAAIVLLSNVAVAQGENLIRVNVSVTESSRDRKVIGLEKENFQLWEDNIVQEIVSMTPGSAAGEYVLAFKSTNSAKDGEWRELRAKVVASKGGEVPIVALNVRFKDGYFAPSPGN